MPRDGRKKPLYRKVNTRTWGVRHGCPRLKRPDQTEDDTSAQQQSMRQGLRHGLDYTPLYRFLISKVGKDWDAVFSEAVSRLDQEAPIWHLVSRETNTDDAIIRVGESSYFSGLFVAGDGTLQKVDPDLTAKTMRPYCACCTHTFNGDRFGLPFAD